MNHVIAVTGAVLALSTSLDAVADETLRYRTEGSVFTIDPQGAIVSITPIDADRNYIPDGQAPALLSLYDGSTLLRPTALRRRPEPSLFELAYPNGSKAALKIENAGNYLRLELLELEPRNGVTAVCWGPIATTIRKLVGETICVVRSDTFAIGMQGLNIRTMGGTPLENVIDNAGGGQRVQPLPGQTVPKTLRTNVFKDGDISDVIRIFRGNAAVETELGSELRLFARDRRQSRVVGKEGSRRYIEGVDDDLLGTAVALFGCPQDDTLDTIEEIELREGLPHPTIDGVWIKRSPRLGEAYMSMRCSNDNIDQALDYATACGFRMIHIGEQFKTRGHFELKTRRNPGGAADLARMVERARARGVDLGVHTLTMFTGANDAYVTPTPSENLCKVGSSVLAARLGADGTEIALESVEFFRDLGGTRTIKVGKELIRYSAVSETAPWKLLDCQRGVHGTEVSSHDAGTSIARLTNNSYKGYYPDIHLQDAYARRLAEVCNETGLRMMDFDGYGGESPTGHGQYGAARFAKLWYESLDQYAVTCGAGCYHYFWHLTFMMNWGEPWYNALRESMINYRIENQRYFERNLLPGMLGWFVFGHDYRPEEIEWIQARSAGFDAGYLLRVSEKNVEANGFKDEHLATIRTWQQARRAGVFDAALREELKDPTLEFHLEAANESSWRLFRVALQRGGEHKFRELQDGQPQETTLEFVNPFARQPVQFYLRVEAVEGDTESIAAGLTLTINSRAQLEVAEELAAGQALYCDGQTLYLCDQNWKRERTLASGSLPHWETGSNRIEVRSEFDGDHPPTLKLDFRARGNAVALTAE